MPTASVYQGEAKADSDFGTAGTLEGWQAGIAAMAVNNPMLALSLCAAFAGPVLEKVNAESGGATPDRRILYRQK